VKNLGIGILCFLRPEYLIQRVREIQTYLPDTHITVLVDKYEGSNTEKLILNDQVRNETVRLKNQGEIAGIILKDKNIGVKRAFIELNEVVLSNKDFFLYIEDDLKIVSNPAAYLAQCIDRMKVDNNLAMACLYDSTFHLFNLRRKKSFLRITYFPKMWGVLLARNFFENHQDESVVEKIAVPTVMSKFDFGDLKLSSALSSFWELKMERAIQSNSAWDTELQLRVWSQNLVCIAPDKNYVRDLGMDKTSVSKKQPVMRYPHFPKYQGSIGEFFCSRCESWGVTRYADRKIRLRMVANNFRRVKFQSKSRY
jgi:hypothetical protein